MVPEGRAVWGVITTCVVATLMLIVTGMPAPPGPVTTMLVELTVLASGASSNVMVMGVSALMHVALAAGLTELTMSGEMSESERVLNVKLYGLARCMPPVLPTADVMVAVYDVPGCSGGLGRKLAVSKS